MYKFLAPIALAAAVAVAGTAVAQTGAVVAGTAPGKGGVAEVVKLTATITAIDKATRDVTLKGPQGNEVTLTAGPDVKNFDKLKVGDQVERRVRRRRSRSSSRRAAALVVARTEQTGAVGRQAGREARRRRRTPGHDRRRRRRRRRGEADRHAQGTEADRRTARSPTPSSSSASRRATRSRRRTRRRSRSPSRRPRRSSGPRRGKRRRAACACGRRCRGPRPARPMSDPRDFAVTETLRNGVAVTIRALRADDRERMATRRPRARPRVDLHAPLQLSQRAHRSGARPHHAVRSGRGGRARRHRRRRRGRGHRRLRPLRRRRARRRRAHGGGRVRRRGGLPRARASRAALLRHLAAIARERGIATFEAEVLAENKAMQAVFARSGLPMRTRREDGVVHVTLALQGGPP